MPRKPNVEFDENNVYKEQDYNIRPTPDAVYTLETLGRAFELRKKGASISEIREALGFSDNNAVSKVMNKALKEYVVENVESYRKLEMARLDDMLWALRDKIKSGDTKAIDSALRILDRRFRLVPGLDANPGGQSPFMGAVNDAIIATIAHRIIDSRESSELAHNLLESIAIDSVGYSIRDKPAELGAGEASDLSKSNSD